METMVEEPADVTADAEEPGETEPLDSGVATPSLDGFKDKHIFISHKCDVQPDDTLAQKIAEDLRDLGCSVYLDVTQPIERYDEAIDQSLQSADFVVA